MSGQWYRIERRDPFGRVRDWVEVGRCVSCGRGVDREFPSQYREIAGQIYCRPCLPDAAHLEPRPAGATGTISGA